MNFKSLFIKDNTSTHKCHIKNLLEVALSDGDIDEEEMVLLIGFAHKCGITKDEINHIRKNPGSVAFKIPKGSKERFSQIHDLVSMMMVNGEINRNELKLCKDLALKMGYLPLIVDDMIAMIAQDVSKGIPQDEIYENIKKMVG